MVRDYLGGAGFRVERAGTGAAGLGTAGARRLRRVILDLMLPDMDGLDVCRQIRAARRRADPDADRARRRHGPRRRPGARRRRLPAQAVRAARAAGPPQGHPAPRAGPRPRADLLRFGRLEIDRGAREVRLDGEAAGADQLSVRASAGACRACRPRDVARRADGHLSRRSRSRPSTARSTCTSRASAPPSRTIPRSRAASSPCAAPATCSPRRRTDAPMRRLYHQFYLTIIASLLLVVLAAGALWRFAPSDTPADQALRDRRRAAGRASGAGRRRVGGAAAGHRPAARAARHRSRAVRQRPPAARRRGPSACRIRRRAARAAAGSTAAAGRPGPSACRTSAGSSPGRRCAPAPSRCRHHRLPRRASRWWSRSAPTRWCAG